MIRCNWARLSQDSRDLWVKAREIGAGHEAVDVDFLVQCGYRGDLVIALTELEWFGWATVYDLSKGRQEVFPNVPGPVEARAARLMGRGVDSDTAHKAARALFDAPRDPLLADSFWRFGK